MLILYRIKDKLIQACVWGGPPLSGLPGGREWWGVPMGVCQGRAWQPGAFPPPSQEPGSWGAPGQPSPGHRAHPWGLGQGGHGPLGGPGSEAHSRAGSGCGELETGPAVASLGQGLTALGGWTKTGRAVDALRAMAAKTNANLQCSLTSLCLAD